MSDDQVPVTTAVQTSSPSRTVMQAISERRSVRAYKPDLVSRDAVIDLLRAAVKAPTAMNEEPWAFVVIQNREIMDELSMSARATIDTARRGHLDSFFSKDFDIFYKAGTLVIICASNS